VTTSDDPDSFDLPDAEQIDPSDADQMAMDLGFDDTGYGNVDASKKDEPKKAQMAPPPPSDGPGPQMATGQVCAAGDMCANAECPEHGKMAQGQMAPPGPGGAQAQAPAMGGQPSAEPGGAAPMPMMGSVGNPLVKEASQKHATRLERLYRGRMAKATEDYTKKLAEVETKAIDKAMLKIVRAMKLAAKRQELNMEFSPLKSAMHDVLASERDLDAYHMYPGMDDETAARLVEATSSVFEEFVNSLAKRASDFLKMSDETLGVIEADIKNLRPTSVHVAAIQDVEYAGKQSLKQAAVDGNLVVAPTSTVESISNVDGRDNIRSALNTTKVHRASQALLKK
jgi:hypothetical protein